MNAVASPTCLGVVVVDKLASNTSGFLYHTAPHLYHIQYSDSNIREVANQLLPELAALLPTEGQTTASQAMAARNQGQIACTARNR